MESFYNFVRIKSLFPVTEYVYVVDGDNDSNSNVTNKQTEKP